MNLTAYMSLHVPLDLASLREPCGAGRTSRAVVPPTTKPLCPLLSRFDVGIGSVLEKLFSVGEDLAADGGAALITPKTPVFLVCPEFDRGVCSRGDRCTADVKRGLLLRVCYLHAVGQRSKR